MPTRVRPRFGSLQFWPRKRAKKALPRVNWDPITKQKGEGILGFIGYKVGMSTALVKDITEKSMTKGKKIAIPVTILEVPNMKIYSVRFYNKGKVLKDVVVSNDKELKRKVKVSKELKKDFKVEGFDDVRVLVYSISKQTNIKKTPDLIELGISAEDKLTFVKELIGKEIAMQDVLKSGLVDVRGLTKGHGFSGPVKRFGITLRSHKSEKGRRGPGSIGPWHPAHVTFRVPMAGQLGMFTRVHYNFNVVGSGTIAEKDINKKEGFRHYGKVKTSYVILRGSVQGTPKRQVLITKAMRPTRKITKNKFEFLELK
jgi:large subunit ribosomal protein L3